jgi:hypothetical protein
MGASSTRYGAVHRWGWTQNRENNPMQSRMGPGSQYPRCVAGLLTEAAHFYDNHLS